jgi:hypothetical protein
MASASHDDITRLFPGLQDHAVLEVLATEATVGELEAASLMLQDADEGLIGVKQRQGDRLSLLLGILARSEIRPRDDVDR